MTQTQMMDIEGQDIGGIFGAQVGYECRCDAAGAGQHGVAMATACALVGIPCEIYMGQVDINKVRPYVYIHTHNIYIGHDY